MPSPTSLPDRFQLYELCVQSPGYDARMLSAIHAFCAGENRPPSPPPLPAGAASRLGTRPRRPTPAGVLGEDFCGTAALCRAWIDLSPHPPTRRRAAIAVDNDAPTLQRAIELNSAPVAHPLDESLERDPGSPASARASSRSPRRSPPPSARPRPGITYILSDVRRVKDRVDILCALNYSLGEFHQRPALVRYLAHARRRLLPGGVFVGDLYSGRDAFLPGTTTQERSHDATGARVRYRWEQRSADPLTGLVHNAIHFDVLPAPPSPPSPRQVRAAAGSRRRRAAWEHLENAFVYRWRLWGIPELREAMHEAGFRHTLVFPRHAEAVDDDGRFHALPFEDPDELAESFSAYVVAFGAPGRS